MRVVKALTLLGVIAMAGILIYGFTVGDFAGEGKTLLAMPWGIVSLVDVYTGIALFSCWVVYRERSATRSIVWVFLMIVLGFFTVSLYTIIALLKSDGDWHRFFMGRRWTREPRSS
jgi:hypothetical protein